MSSVPLAFVVIIVVAAFIVAIIVTVSALYFQHRKQQMWHETARLALEKGQPLPAMPPRDEELAMRPPPGVSFAEWQQAKLAEARTHAFRGGLVLVAVGAGLHLMLGSQNYLGAIPAFIGLALIVNALIERFVLRRDTAPANESRPPQS
jgi:Flp pilus assembly protein TadB